MLSCCHFRTTYGARCAHGARRYSPRHIIHDCWGAYFPVISLSRVYHHDYHDVLYEAPLVFARGRAFRMHIREDAQSPFAAAAPR